MIDKNDFQKKHLIFFFPSQGDALSFKNDNLVVKENDKTVKFQCTCYRIFILFVVGDTKITTGLLQRANKFGFSICLMNRNMKVYKVISSRMEGNTFLRKMQYSYDSNDLARWIISNKIQNQRAVLKSIRNKSELRKEAVSYLEKYEQELLCDELNISEIMGLEGAAAKMYFPQVFDMVKWRGRKPRIKFDYVNAILDIGYTILFNLIDALLNVYGFDEYYGVLHRCFYMRKSLVCDIMEPFRPVVDYCIRKNINLGKFKEEDFELRNKQYMLKWKCSAEYSKTILDSILEYKDDIFVFIQSYYRAFMKQKDIEEYVKFEM